jgi:replicative DNA helicase
MTVQAIDFRSRADDDAPPHLVNLEAEQAVLGAILFDNQALSQAPDGLLPEHFGEPFHQRLFEAMAARIGKGTLAEPVELSIVFKDDEAFRELGGLRYLADLTANAPGSLSAKHFGEIVIDLATRRRMVDFARALILRAQVAGTEAAADIANDAEQQISALARGVEPSDANLVEARSSAEYTMAEIDDEAENGRPRGKMTGLRCVDRRLRGLIPGKVIVIGGRPSMGKTALVRVLMYGAAGRNPHDLFGFFALEMSRRELDERALSHETFIAGDGVAYQDMASGKLDPITRKRVRDQLWKIPRNLIVDDASSLTIEHVERRVWALKRKGNLAAVAIDYLQIMDMPNIKGMNTAERVGQVTKRLKNLARAAGICIVLLSQLSRESERRDDKRPQLADLRESGSIEQDADAVLFPFREGYYVERSEPKEGTAEHTQWEQDVEILRRRMDVLCAKNRGGAVGTDRQEYFAECDAIRDAVEEGRGH